MHMTVENNTPLLEALTLLFPKSSKATLRSWIKEGRVTIDGVIASRSDTVVLKGQAVALTQKQRLVERKIPLLYEDRHLVIIDKPSGLLSVAAAFEKGETAHALLKKHYHPRKVYVVHRLDQDTSGVMLYALSEEGYEGLKALFEKHTIERSYCAIVEGHLSTNSGSWNSYLYEDANYVVHSTDDPTLGRIATTHYAVEGRSSKYSRLKLTLETGRKNQIRVHCSDHGIPVVGDKKYGAATDPFHRLCLHAQLLAFTHPITGKQMRFESPPPDLFNRLVKKKYA